MKVSRTLLSLLLILILSFSILAACASEPAGTSSTPADISGTESAAEGFPLEEKNFGGKEITILCVDRHTYGVMQFAPDSEINANAVNDAVAERNNFIEEKYGLTIKTVGEDFPIETLRLAVTSGIDDYDMICDTILALMPLIPENLYLELDDYIDITNEWWDQNANELLTFNDKHYLVSGDAIITDDDYTYLLLFNKEMYANNSDLSGKYGDLYDLVREGKWTLDVMHEMMKAVSQPDIDGAWTENATYGMAGSNNIGNVFLNAAATFPLPKQQTVALKSRSATKPIWMPSEEYMIFFPIQRQRFLSSGSAPTAGISSTIPSVKDVRFSIQQTLQRSPISKMKRKMSFPSEYFPIRSLPKSRKGTTTMSTTETAACWPFHRQMWKIWRRPAICSSCSAITGSTRLSSRSTMRIMKPRSSCNRSKAMMTPKCSILCSTTVFMMYIRSCPGDHIQRLARCTDPY